MCRSGCVTRGRYDSSFRFIEPRFVAWRKNTAGLLQSRELVLCER